MTDSFNIIMYRGHMIKVRFSKFYAYQVWDEYYETLDQAKESIDAAEDEYEESWRQLVEGGDN